MRLLSVFLLAPLIVSSTAALAGANFVISHVGATDPLTEGFSTLQAGQPSSAGPIANDMGRAVWSIAGTTQSSQFGYQSGALSIDERNDIVNQGFVLTFEARVVQGLAQNYDNVNHVTIGGASVDVQGIPGKQARFDVFLGLDSNGDTVAVLPTSVATIPFVGAVTSPGPSYTLTGSGSSYHTYQLVYDSITKTADLFIDGILRLEDYAGHGDQSGDRGLVWAAFSGGQGNFSFVELASIPEPSAFLLMGLVALLGAACRFVASRC
jgi:hypothetical protein